MLFLEPSLYCLSHPHALATLLMLYLPFLLYFFLPLPLLVQTVNLEMTYLTLFSHILFCWDAFFNRLVWKSLFGLCKWKKIPWKEIWGGFFLVQPKSISDTWNHGSSLRTFSGPRKMQGLNLYNLIELYK